jgi:hypothetical protein
VGTAHLMELTFTVGDAQPMTTAELALVRRTDYSDDCQSAMQRRYLMPRHPPIAFWLLFVTMVLLDLAILGSASVADRNTTAFYGMVFGQLSAVCVWCVFSLRRLALRWFVTGLAVVAAAWATLANEHYQMPIADALGLNAFLAATMLLALWLYKLVLTLRQPRRAAAAQFSMKDLFVLTTSVALVAALLRGSQFMQELPLFVMFVVLTNVVVAVACLVFWSRAWHALPRLGATLAVAVASGWCLTYLRPHLSGELEVMMTLHAIILFSWLELGDIVPKNCGTSDANADGAPTLNTVQ